MIKRQIDTRIELRLQDATSCSFIASLPYSEKPSYQDFVYITDTLISKVKSVCHILKTSDITVILEPLLYEDQDLFIKDLDYLKANYELTDFQSNSKPISYYSFYRSLVNLLGRSKEVNPSIDPDPISFKIIAESCRSIILAELFNGAEEQGSISIASYIVNNKGQLNACIEDLHRIMIDLKNSGKDLMILDVIKEWEPRFNSHKLEWTASNADCLRIAKIVFNNIKSIPESRKPGFT